jgi:hypothetical protein
VADECCDTSFDLVVASMDVPEVAPPTLQNSPNGHVLPGEQSTPVAPVRTPPLPSPHQTTVLLI